MKVYKYSIHDFFAFSVINNANLLKTLSDNIYLQLENFSTDQSIKDNLSIEIGSFSPDLESTQIVDDRFWVKDKYFYTEGKRKFAKWKMDLRFHDDLIKFRIDTNVAGAVTKPHYFAEFLIQIVLLQKNISVVHAAALEREGNVLLLPGTSGGGKTTICMSLIDKGYNFLGDNYSILKDGEVYSYSSPLNIFSYNLVPTIKNSLSKFQLFDLYARLLLYKLSGGYLKIFKKINPKNIINNISDHGKLSNVVFLVPSTGNDIALTEITKNLAIARLNINMKLEWVDIADIAESYSITNNSIFDNYWELSRKALTKNLSAYKNQYYELSVPTVYSDKGREKVIEILESLMAQSKVN